MRGCEIILRHLPVIYQDGSFGKTDVLSALRTKLRVLHYSYRTEQTYHDWACRFFAYLSSVGGTLKEDRYDRSTLLPESVKSTLQIHMERVRDLHQKDLAAGVGEVWLPDALARKYPKAGVEIGWQYLFPSKSLATDPRSGKVRRHHVSDNVIQRAVRDAAQKTGIAKPVSVHCLRHSFATALLLNGVDIRQIQEYLGHVNVETTMIYTHVVKDMRNPATSPLDMLRRKSA